ncbi:hypothetical protein SK128_026324 [Halocaridina rubra]|uniref:Fanconi anemia core complex-associated protein 24 n=1 Tax=Halocaridina rubra TaxID=373956 RepID=A0AAN8WM44_HALRR
MSSPVVTKPSVPEGCIYVSVAWNKTQLGNNLAKLSNVVFLDGLGVVDFHPSNNVAVIFISEAELLSENAYRTRVVKFRQANTDMRRVVIVQITSLTSNLYGPLQKFVVLELGLSLMSVSTTDEAAQLLAQMVTCEAKINSNPFRMKTKPKSPDAALLAATTMIPSLGKKRALQLLKQFGSLKSLSNASQESIAEIVGHSSASVVYNFFHSGS